MLRAEAKAIGEQLEEANREHFLVDLPRQLDEWETKPTTMQQLRWADEDPEKVLRRAVPKEQQQMIRAKLVAEFGRSTVGELFEVVAKRILERGSVANDEEFETVEPFVWTDAQDGARMLGDADHKRLCGLLEDYRQR